LIEEELSRCFITPREGASTVAKSYKPAGESSSKNRLCLRCFNCRTRIFRDLKELVKWCYERELDLRVPWKKRFKKEGKLCIYWCVRLPLVRPRIYKEVDLPFKMNCSMFDGGEIYG
jgi:hypothetical protein